METLVPIIACFIFFILGANAGWRARERHATRTLDKFLEQAKEKQPEECIAVSIEKHHDVFYVFERDTNKFMAQGASKEEVENVLNDRFPGKKFGASEKNLVEVGFLS